MMREKKRGKNKWRIIISYNCIDYTVYMAYNL